MASYKVPQDVEADDKLLGPFSFRQFIYLIIVAASGAIAWVLGNLFIPLAIIPLPVIIFFGALALPLRKDQPMETYLAAIVSYYVKPHKRLWDPDGQQASVQIVAPKIDSDRPALKDLSQEEADKRFSYLAGIVDSRGWAVRGVDPSAANSAVNSDVYYEAQQIDDIMDQSNHTAQIIDTRIDQANAQHRQQLIAQMHTSVTQQPVTPLAQPPTQTTQQVTQASPQAQVTSVPEPQLTINPYPNSMQQSIVQPLSVNPQPQMVAQSVQTISENQPTPDIINLANNPDLSIETIAREANRIREKGLPSEEVVISLH